MTYRGSRKHILDWVEQPRFLPELLELAAPVECRISPTSRWMPVGYRSPDEARLETFGPVVLPSSGWSDFSKWWLIHRDHANTPNWDIALSCEIGGRPGLVLVEAKANCPELSTKGKGVTSPSSERSRQNHDRIGLAIAEARAALEGRFPGIGISRDTHYQLSNRIAFAWRLARMGIPTTIVYLGFTGDEGIRDVGEPFRDHAHWNNSLLEYCAGVSPTTMWEAPIDVDGTSFWLLSRSRPILEQSPSAT